jgi:hypothetical protein
MKFIKKIIIIFLHLYAFRIERPSQVQRDYNRTSLGYSKWQRFENAIEKAIESCNNPEHHFTKAGNPITSGKGRTQIIEDYHGCSCLSFKRTFGLISLARSRNQFKMNWLQKASNIA